MYKTILKRIARSVPHGIVGRLVYHYPCHQSTYSRFAEDIPLSRLLPEPTGFYVDVGAFHPKFRSNTYLLWKRGWHGINVDVDEYKIAQFRRFRPQDVNLTVGVSSEDTERTFYFQQGGSYGSMSSFEQQFAIDRGNRMDRTVGARMVPVLTLNTILERYLPRNTDGNVIPVDLIDIDVEGHEYEILRVFDFERFRPRCLCVEIHADGVDELTASPTFQLLQQKGYELSAWPAPSCIFMAKTTERLERSDVARPVLNAC
jgi:FkbM family methyltransferase